MAMPLSAGNKLGPYELLAPLGKGGMGEVWKALDTRLDRIVAIKVSHERFSERFEREARTIASLNHPNICQLYDVGPDYLVMELVDGSPVAPGLGVRKVLDVAVQIASGLVAAHSAGIVHRDLKPDNILITRESRVKILDFGLAKQVATSHTGDESNTLALGNTIPGTVAGTVYYMSPEQARGMEVDARSDQFSFGLILYELLSGKRAFARESAAQTMTAIIESEPDYTVLTGVPTAILWIIERCLAKDPHDRYDSTGDLYRDLEQIKRRQGELSSSATGVAPAKPARKRFRWLAPIVTAAVAGVGIGWFSASRTNSPPPRYKVTPVAVDAAAAVTPAWSPDGKLLAYSQEAGGYYQIFTRSVDDQRSSAPAQLTVVRQDCLFPFWHPSGDRIYFMGGRALWVVGASGGQPEKVAEDTYAATISPDGKALVLARFEKNGVTLWTATPDGKNLTRRTELKDSGGLGRILRFSPDGRTLGMTSGLNRSKLVLAKYPLSSSSFPDREIDFSFPMRPVALRSFAWMPDSRHVVLNISEGFTSSSLWLGDIPTKTAIPLTNSELLHTDPSVSPDGSRIAYGATTMNWDIEQIDLRTRAVTPLVASARYDGWPAWTPSGEQLAFTTTRTGRPEIWLKSLREGWERPILGPEDFPKETTLMLAQPAVSPNGRSVAYQRFEAPGGIQIFVSPLSGGKPVQLEPSGYRQDYPAWSPDGSWIAFHSQGALQKARPGGGAAAVRIRDDARGYSGIVKWSRRGQILYFSAKGLAITNEDGAAARVILAQIPLVCDWSSDGSLIYAIRETPERRMELFTLDPNNSQIHVLADVGRVPVTPDPIGVPVTIRSLAVSPDGTRAAFAYLQPDSKIWMLEKVKAP